MSPVVFLLGAMPMVEGGVSEVNVGTSGKYPPPTELLRSSVPSFASGGSSGETSWSAAAVYGKPSRG